MTEETVETVETVERGDSTDRGGSSRYKSHNDVTRILLQWTLVNPDHVNPKSRKFDVQNQLINN